MRCAMACYAIVIEDEPGDYSAFVPDWPGCVVADKAIEALLQQMSPDIRFHIAGLQEDELPVPLPTTMVDYIKMEG